MIDFDPSQLQALGLDPARHASVVGAPGSGKTRVLVECFVRAVEREGWSEDDVLVIAPNRLAATDLRGRVERGLGRAIGGTLVRTAASLAFAVLARGAALDGREAPRLLTGTAQDEEIAEVVEQVLAGAAAAADDNAAVFPFAVAAPANGAEGDSGSRRSARVAGLVPEVLRSPAFRAELRELWRITDDFDLAPLEFAAQLRRLQAGGADETFTQTPPRELIERWHDGLRLISPVLDRLASTRPGELSSSALLRTAAATVRESGTAHAVRVAGPERFRVPRLLLVDDAQELGEGELALIAACASVGSSVWVFGDPDEATGAFHGERTAVLARLNDELERRGGAAARLGASDPVGVSDRAGAEGGAEQRVVLQTAHRHGAQVRGLVRELTTRIGAAGRGEQRAAGAAREDEGAALDGAGAVAAQVAEVQFAAVASPAEQLGAVAHRLRARHLGLGGRAAVAWSDMAVICRSRAEALRAARVLAAHQVPTGVAAGGIVLREHQVVRELIRLLRHSLGLAPLTGDEVLRLTGGVVGGLDPVAVRRLRGALLLQERRDARAEDREISGIDELALEAFTLPGETAVVDSSGGRALRRLGIIAGEAARVRASGGTARETLWALWEGTRLADAWQREALEGRGARADEAHRSLDAVTGLFFALQRHEEQNSEQPIEELLDDLLLSAVPEDSLAQRSQRTAVTVTTPQGAIGREFAIVAVIGLQDGAWPNLRARGSLLGTAALERWLRGGEAMPPSRKDTIHDELRLFAHSCARAREELLVVAIADEDQHPSAFFGLGRNYRDDELPSARLTLRGATAEMRRRLTLDPTDEGALRALSALARERIAGAEPDEWYGVLPPSTEEPLFDLGADLELRVPVSPSQLERAEACPLDWAIAALGGGTGSVQANLGTLVHHALETAEGHSADAMFEAVRSEWRKLRFDADWESERAERVARAMTESLAAYLRDFDSSGRRLLGRETPFEIPIERAVLRGMADRLELVHRADGEREITVLDLKTGRTPPSKAAAEEHAQLQAYQLGVSLGAFALAEDENSPAEQSPPAEQNPPAQTRSGGARLLYVHPDATKNADYVERVQQPIDADAMDALKQRVADISEVMAAGEFTAHIEHHCSDPHRPGNCRLHVIQAVSNG
ncbi:MAG: PD-(D/E)XK nuclease family protein [Leucobacter sp.]